MASPKSPASAGIGPIVSASHLADGGMPAMSEMEFALVILSNAYQRWITRCTAAAGGEGLSAIEVQILHAVNHRERDKSQSELCMMFNIEDTHVVAYALKKLEALGLVQPGRRGKEKTARITKKGADLCLRYRALREKLLIESVASLGLDEARVSEIASLMRVMSGQYDQASRAAASY
ncbi:MAG: winged helix DNA-binding protein [Hoeflea sp.]|uniref:winged helix DNA-binding protein n=1 Tax=Hoeflea sp. TaxID=1940281 RepID=UPI001E16377F|nr:winged helix DNA-binding protein [Hoeflea sp.]MBU4529978.1 winged helix DNA-binding protein [Alphaproteobacteria bacterium]MBU4543205.1 winged helix DNA-binding protein [Alphaproteobacteria bacterium]MBU4550255.1 winged helix DNA-binding protein [Alphaproteobacteria bacterium]MBV1722471.1 winged helix DNA-binding protein [Hoeflea sp.]MBV1761621.1 winged helix DNA-binding protein [Hoeflea sp.]